MIRAFCSLGPCKPEDERQRVTGYDAEESGDSLSLVFRLARRAGNSMASAARPVTATASRG